jgi:hypothetical protein
MTRTIESGQLEGRILGKNRADEGAGGGEVMERRRHRLPINYKFTAQVLPFGLNFQLLGWASPERVI